MAKPNNVSELEHRLTDYGDHEPLFRWQIEYLLCKARLEKLLNETKQRK